MWYSRRPGAICTSAGGRCELLLGVSGGRAWGFVCVFWGGMGMVVVKCQMCGGMMFGYHKNRCWHASSTLVKT